MTELEMKRIEKREHYKRYAEYYRWYQRTLYHVKRLGLDRLMFVEVS